MTVSRLGIDAIWIYTYILVYTNDKRNKKHVKQLNPKCLYMPAHRQLWENSFHASTNYIIHRNIGKWNCMIKHMHVQSLLAVGVQNVRSNRIPISIPSPASWRTPKGSLFGKAPGWSSSRIAEVADRPNPTARWVHGRSDDTAEASDGRRSWHSWERFPARQRSCDGCCWVELQMKLIYSWYVPSVKKSTSFAWCASSPITINYQWSGDMRHATLHFSFGDVGFTCNVGYSVHSLNKSYTSFELLFSTQLCVCPIDISWGWVFQYFKCIMWKDITIQCQSLAFCQLGQQKRWEILMIHATYPKPWYCSCGWPGRFQVIHHGKVMTSWQG